MNTFNQTRSIAAALTLLAAGSVAVYNAQPGKAAAAAPGRVPVLVELFTSEGCSSCPPADKLLQRLVKTQPVPGAQVIALEEHVDYWDHNGWRDPFSSPYFTKRQNDYAARSGSDEVYTPEMVVAGRSGFVGSDGSQAASAIESQAQGQARRAAPIPAITVGDGFGGLTKRVRVTVAPGLPTGARIVVAVTEDSLASHVANGENAGRTLEHIATAREMSVIGTVSGAGEFSADYQTKRHGASFHVIAFAQDPRTLAVYSAAQAQLP